MNTHEITEGIFPLRTSAYKKGTVKEKKSWKLKTYKKTTIQHKKS